MRTFVLALASLIGFSTLTSAPSQAATPDPMAGAPTVGECHNLTWAQMSAQSDVTPAVACSATHTAKLVKVGVLPDAMSYADPATADYVAQQCIPANNAAVGGTVLTRVLTMYRDAQFYPTADQQTAGARWYSCYVDLWSKYGTMAPMRVNTDPLLANGVTRKAQKCLAGTSYIFVLCTLTHQWKATGAFKMRKGTFPTSTQMAKSAQANCPRLVTTKRYLYQKPTRAEWKSGWRVMVCYSKTTS